MGRHIKRDRGSRNPWGSLSIMLCRVMNGLETWDCGTFHLYRPHGSRTHLPAEAQARQLRAYGHHIMTTVWHDQMMFAGFQLYDWV
jgi:hypothetical protein